MTQHDFNQLLETYLAGDCSPEEERQILDWSEGLLKTSTPSLPASEQASLQKRLWARIARSTVAPVRVIQWRRWTALGVAASVLLLLLTWQAVRPLRSAPLPTGTLSTLKGVVEVKNTSENTQRVPLHDGSVVVLKAGSSISYPDHFGAETRSVILKGEAFFQVKPDATKPFIVHTGDLRTEVLGTSFTIKSYENTPSIEVQVTTGRVSVYEAKESPSNSARNGVILTPNQRVIYEKRTKTLTPGLVENALAVKPPASPQEFIFSETPLPQVLIVLREAYGVDIVLENEALNRCVFTADLNGLPLYAQLDLLCRSVNATYERRGTSLFVNGEGCH